MTGMPAARLGLAGARAGRGGGVADLVVFDPATVADRATFQDPHQYPVGIPLGAGERDRHGGERRVPRRPGGAGAAEGELREAERRFAGGWPHPCCVDAAHRSCRPHHTGVDAKGMCIACRGGAAATLLERQSLALSHASEAVRHDRRTAGHRGARRRRLPLPPRHRQEHRGLVARLAGRAVPPRRPRRARLLRHQRIVIAFSVRKGAETWGYLGRFALRRSLRLDPPYWLTLALELALIRVGLMFVPSLGTPVRLWGRSARTCSTHRTSSTSATSCPCSGRCATRSSTTSSSWPG